MRAKKNLKSKMCVDEDGKDSCIEDRDDKEVGRREDLQRFLGNIPFMFINNQIIVAWLNTVVSMPFKVREGIKKNRFFFRKKS